MRPVLGEPVDRLRFKWLKLAAHSEVDKAQFKAQLCNLHSCGSCAAHRKIKGLLALYCVAR